MKKLLSILVLITLSLFFLKITQISYAASTPEDHQAFSAIQNKLYWKGAINFAPDYVWHDNYMAKYINQVILPEAGNYSEFSAAVNSFVNIVKTTGIEITLPDNLGVAIFVSVWNQQGIDPWHELSAAETIFIKMPDLVVEGLNYPGGVDEAWGENVIYIVDGTSYTYSQKNTFNQIIPPRIGIRLIADETYTISFNTNGGSSISSQQVLSGQFPSTPTPPTRTGYTFYGWSDFNPLNPIIPHGTFHPTVWPHQREASANTTYYALWRTLLITVTLQLNGGKLTETAISTANTLTVEYGNTIYQNMLGLDFDEVGWRSGYELEGWYTNAALTVPFNPDTPLISNLTIYAKWTKVYTSINQLPETEGNPYNAGKTGSATFTYIGSVFDAAITYDGQTYNIQVNISGSTSDNFLNNVGFIDYYTIDGKPYLQINYTNSSNPLLNIHGDNTNFWEGFTMWNLTNNKISVTQKALVLTYLTMDQQTRDAFAYFYMPSVIMDDLMSVSLAYMYRLIYPLGITGKWQPVARVLERGEDSIMGVPQDILDLYTFSGAAIAAGVVIPIVRWPLLLTGGILMNYANLQLLNHLMHGAISEIEPVQASASLRLELNQAYTRLAGRPVSVNASEQVYKLYIGTLSGIGSSTAEIDNDTFRYMEINWVRDGQVYTTLPSYMDQRSSVDPEWEQIVRDALRPPIADWLKSVIIVLVTLAMVMVAVFKANVFSKPSRFIPIGIVYAIIIILINMMI